jgi:PhnB protein
MAGQAKPVPDGYHSVTPYLVVRNAPAAIDFYKKTLGATEIMRIPGPGGRIMHAELKIGTSIVMLSEEMPEMGSRSPQSFNGSPVSLFVYCEDVDKVYGAAIAAGATSKMPVADMFWGDRWGALVDPFGHEWQIATHKEDLTPEEMAKRGAAAMGGA